MKKHIHVVEIINKIKMGTDDLRNIEIHEPRKVGGHPLKFCILTEAKLVEFS